MASKKKKTIARKVHDTANAVGPYALVTLGAAVGVDAGLDNLEAIVNVPQIVEDGVFYGSLTALGWKVLKPVYDNGLFNAGKLAVNAVYNFRKPKSRRRVKFKRTNIRSIKKRRREFGDSTPRRKWRSAWCTAGLIALLATPTIKNHTQYVTGKVGTDIKGSVLSLTDLAGTIWDKTFPGKQAPVVPGPANYAKMYEQLQYSTQEMQQKAEDVAEFININKRSYVSVAKRTGVPWFVVGAIHYRESSGKFDTYLHNGEKLGRRTKLVPKGILFHNWDDAADDALKKHFVANQKKYGTIEAIERYNGLGYRSKTCSGRQVQTPYLWGGTTHHKGGRYYADRKFSCSSKSTRPGAMAVIKAMEQQGYIPRQHF